MRSSRIDINNCTFDSIPDAIELISVFAGEISYNTIINSKDDAIDLNNSEKFILWLLAIPVLFFGFYPEPLINTIEVSIKDLIEMYNFNINKYTQEVSINE